MIIVTILAKLSVILGFWALVATVFESDRKPRIRRVFRRYGPAGTWVPQPWVAPQHFIDLV